VGGRGSESDVKKRLADFFEVFEGFRTEFKVQFISSEGRTTRLDRKIRRNGDAGVRFRLFRGCFGR